MCVYYTTQEEWVSLKIFLMILKCRNDYLHIFCVTAIYGLNWAAFLKQVFANNTGKVSLGVFGRRRFTENLYQDPKYLILKLCWGPISGPKA